jgi:serine/threonine protein kinase
MGTIYCALYNSKLYSIKKLPKFIVTTQKTKDDLINEINISSAFNHPGLSTLRNVVQSQTSYYLVYDHYPLGTLQSFLQILPNRRISEEAALPLIKQIVLAYAELHSKGVVHRDITASNIYLQKRPDGTLNAVLTGFGFSKIIQHGSIKDHMMESKVGDPLYMSPEELLNNPYNYKTDIYSIGVLYYYMLMGAYPFQACSISDLQEKYMEGKFEIDLSQISLSKHSIDFIISCLQFDSVDRIGLDKIISHPIITLPTCDILSNPLKEKIIKLDTKNKQNLSLLI